MMFKGCLFFFVSVILVTFEIEYVNAVRTTKRKRYSFRRADDTKESEGTEVPLTKFEQLVSFPVYQFANFITRNYLRQNNVFKKMTKEDDRLDKTSKWRLYWSRLCPFIFGSMAKERSSVEKEIDTLPAENAALQAENAKAAAEKAAAVQRATETAEAEALEAAQERDALTEKNFAAKLTAPEIKLAESNAAETALKKEIGTLKAEIAAANEAKEAAAAEAKAAALVEAAEEREALSRASAHKLEQTIDILRAKIARLNSEKENTEKEARATVTALRTEIAELKALSRSSADKVTALETEIAKLKAEKETTEKVAIATAN